MGLFFAILFVAFSSWSAHPALAEPLSVGPAPAIVATSPRIPTRIAAANGEPEELGPVLTAQSAAVLDADSGVLLWGKQPYAVRPLASITKLLTAIAYVEVRDDRDGVSQVQIVADDIPEEGNTIVESDDIFAVHDLLAAMLIRSDNGAARALARSDGALVSGDAQERTARRLGLRSVRVTDPAGLRSDNRGTAVDAARLLAAALAEDPLRSLLATARTTVDAHRDGRRALPIVTTNALLTDGREHSYTLIGGKTGYLDEAGYNFVIEVERDGATIVVAVLGAATHLDRFRDVGVLADWIFQHFDWSEAQPG
ncbi:MAG: serine hydrolase [bacterium]|nr:serine hydrolase [bacterium]